MPQPVRKTFMFVAALAAIAAGAASFAGAASTKSSTTPSSSSSSSSSSSQRPDRPRQTQLTGATADKVTAAAKAKVPGGTVLRVETGGHGGAAYHAHVRKSDGGEVVVLVNSSFEAIRVETDRGRRGGHGRRHGGPGGRGAEKALTGETATKVKAAAQAKVPGGTVLRVETDADHGSPYEAHVRKSDGTEVEVLVDQDFEVTAVNEQRGRP